MYAVIETGGKQYKVSENMCLKVEKLDAQPGEEITIEQVLMVNDGNGNIKIGNPLVEDARVTAKILEQGRGKKITVFKYKKRKKYRRKQGHRQSYTQIQIKKIEI